MSATEESLESWLTSQLSLFLGFDDELLAKYILAIEGPRDVEEFLINLLGESAETGQFIQEVIIRRFSLRDREDAKKEKTLIEAALSVTSKAEISEEATVIATSKVFIPKKERPPRPALLAKSFKETAELLAPFPISNNCCYCQGEKSACVLNCVNCGKVLCDNEIIPQLDPAVFSRKQQTNRTKLPSGNALFEFLLSHQIIVHCTFCNAIPYIADHLAASPLHSQLGKLHISVPDSTATEEVQQEYRDIGSLRFVDTEPVKNTGKQSTSTFGYGNNVLQHNYLSEKFW